MGFRKESSFDLEREALGSPNGQTIDCAKRSSGTDLNNKVVRGSLDKEEGIA
jgi:hypothetical protein